MTQNHLTKQQKIYYYNLPSVSVCNKCDVTVIKEIGEDYVVFMTDVSHGASFSNIHKRTILSGGRFRYKNFHLQLEDFIDFDFVHSFYQIEQIRLCGKE